MHAASGAVPHAILVNLMCCWIAETYTLEAWELNLARLAVLAEANDVNHQCHDVQACKVVQASRAAELYRCPGWPQLGPGGSFSY